MGNAPLSISLKCPPRARSDERALAAAFCHNEVADIQAQTKSLRLKPEVSDLDTGLETTVPQLGRERAPRQLDLLEFTFRPSPAAHGLGACCVAFEPYKWRKIAFARLENRSVHPSNLLSRHRLFEESLALAESRVDRPVVVSIEPVGEFIGHIRQIQISAIGLLVLPGRSSEGRSEPCG